MTKQNESKLSTTIVNALNARGHCVFKHFSGVYSSLGITDLLGCRNDGLSVFLEVKQPGKEITGVSAVQAAFMQRVIKATNGRAIVAVVSSVAEAIRVVELPAGRSLRLADGRFSRQTD